MKEPKESRVNVRVPGVLVARLDALIPRVRALPECSLLGTIDRSKVARLALARGVEVLEREVGRKRAE